MIIKGGSRVLTEDRKKELRDEVKKLGVSEIRARLANLGTYNLFEAPYVKGLIEDYLNKRIKPKDIIMASLTLLSIISAIIFHNQNKQLIDNQQQIYNKAQVVQQYITTNNYNFPAEIVEAINGIRIASGPIVTISKNKNESLR